MGDELDLDLPIRYNLVIANLIVQGLFTETDEGATITAKGKVLARKKWMGLPDEDKLLYTWLLRTLFRMGKL